MTRLLQRCAGALLDTGLLVSSACNPPGGQTPTTDGSLASRSFVPPGELDEYDLFYSGGHSGQVYVAGLPSMRHIATIPVFAPYPATGYGFDEETREMLRDFKTRQVFGPIPNSAGTHGSSFVTEIRVRPRRYPLLRPTAEGPVRAPLRVREGVQRHGERPEGRPHHRHAVGRRAGADPAVQLGHRLDRQGPELGLGVLDVVQLRDGLRNARGHVDAGRS